MDPRSRSKKPALSKQPTRLAAALSFAAFAFGANAPAMAGSFYHDHAYADSYGNLVIYSPAGYKAIVVGKGYLAPKLAEATGKTPHIVYGSAATGVLSYLADRCARSAVIVHGRSYMYGLPDHAVPVLADDYCDR
jgi:hypothetical protein